MGTRDDVTSRLFKRSLVDRGGRPRHLAHIKEVTHVANDGLDNGDSSNTESEGKTNVKSRANSESECTVKPSEETKSAVTSTETKDFSEPDLEQWTTWKETHGKSREKARTREQKVEAQRHQETGVEKPRPQETGVEKPKSTREISSEKPTRTRGTSFEKSARSRESSLEKSKRIKESSETPKRSQGTSVDRAKGGQKTTSGKLKPSQEIGAEKSQRTPRASSEKPERTQKNSIEQSKRTQETGSVKSKRTQEASLEQSKRTQETSSVKSKRTQEASSQQSKRTQETSSAKFKRRQETRLEKSKRAQESSSAKSLRTRETSLEKPKRTEEAGVEERLHIRDFWQPARNPKVAETKPSGHKAPINVHGDRQKGQSEPVRRDSKFEEKRTREPPVHRESAQKPKSSPEESSPHNLGLKSLSAAFAAKKIEVAEKEEGLKVGSEDVGKPERGEGDSSTERKRINKVWNSGRPASDEARESSEKQQKRILVDSREEVSDRPADVCRPKTQSESSWVHDKSADSSSTRPRKNKKKNKIQKQRKKEKLARERLENSGAFASGVTVSKGDSSAATIPARSYYHSRPKSHPSASSTAHNQPPPSNWPRSTSTKSHSDWPKSSNSGSTVAKGVEVTKCASDPVINSPENRRSENSTQRGCSQSNPVNEPQPVDLVKSSSCENQSVRVEFCSSRDSPLASETQDVRNLPATPNDSPKEISSVQYSRRPKRSPFIIPPPVRARKNIEPNKNADTNPKEVRDLSDNLKKLTIKPRETLVFTNSNQSPKKNWSEEEVEEQEELFEEGPDPIELERKGPVGAEASADEDSAEIEEVLERFQDMELQNRGCSVRSPFSEASNDGESPGPVKRPSDTEEQSEARRFCGPDRRRRSTERPRREVESQSDIRSDESMQLSVRVVSPNQQPQMRPVTPPSGNLAPVRSSSSSTSNYSTPPEQGWRMKWIPSPTADTNEDGQLDLDIGTRIGSQESPEIRSESPFPSRTGRSRRSTPSPGQYSTIAEYAYGDSQVTEIDFYGEQEFVEPESEIEIQRPPVAYHPQNLPASPGAYPPPAVHPQSMSQWRQQDPQWSNDGANWQVPGGYPQSPEFQQPRVPQPRPRWQQPSGPSPQPRGPSPQPRGPCPQPSGPSPPVLRDFTHPAGAYPPGAYPHPPGAYPHPRGAYPHPAAACPPAQPPQTSPQWQQRPPGIPPHPQPESYPQQPQPGGYPNHHGNQPGGYPQFQGNLGPGPSREYQNLHGNQSRPGGYPHHQGKQGPGPSREYHGNQSHPPPGFAPQQGPPGGYMSHHGNYGQSQHPPGYPPEAAAHYQQYPGSHPRQQAPYQQAPYQQARRQKTAGEIEFEQKLWEQNEQMKLMKAQEQQLHYTDPDQGDGADDGTYEMVVKSGLLQDALPPPPPAFDPNSPFFHQPPPPPPPGGRSQPTSPIESDPVFKRPLAPRAPSPRLPQGPPKPPSPTKSSWTPPRETVRAACGRGRGRGVPRTQEPQKPGPPGSKLQGSDQNHNAMKTEIIYLEGFSKSKVELKHDTGLISTKSETIQSEVVLETFESKKSYELEEGEIPPGEEKDSIKDAFGRELDSDTMGECIASQHDSDDDSELASSDNEGTGQECLASNEESEDTDSRAYLSANESFSPKIANRMDLQSHVRKMNHERAQQILNKSRPKKADPDGDVSASEGTEHLELKMKKSKSRDKESGEKRPSLEMSRLTVPPGFSPLDSIKENLGDNEKTAPPGFSKDDAEVNRRRSAPPVLDSRTNVPDSPDVEKSPEVVISRRPIHRSPRNFVTLGSRKMPQARTMASIAGAASFTPKTQWSGTQYETPPTRSTASPWAPPDAPPISRMYDMNFPSLSGAGIKTTVNISHKPREVHNAADFPWAPAAQKPGYEQRSWGNSLGQKPYPTFLKPDSSPISRLYSASSSDSLDMIGFRESPKRDWTICHRWRLDACEVPYVDSHCHIDFLLSRSKYQGTWSDYQRDNPDPFMNNYAGCVTNFCDPNSYKMGGRWQQILKEDKVWAAFGCHPKSVSQFTHDKEMFLKHVMTQDKVVALGEIGLDYSGRFMEQHEAQKEAFVKQLQIALHYQKPLVIHCRQAEEDCLKIMKQCSGNLIRTLAALSIRLAAIVRTSRESKFVTSAETNHHLVDSKLDFQYVPHDYPIHRHCFTDDWNTARPWLDYYTNCYIGLTPLVTYKSAKEVHEVAATIPLERLLLETDAPYFVPAYVSKSQLPLNSPGLAISVADEVARLRDIDFEIVLRHARRNTRTLYKV